MNGRERKRRTLKIMLLLIAAAIICAGIFVFRLIRSNMVTGDRYQLCDISGRPVAVFTFKDDDCTVETEQYHDVTTNIVIRGNSNEKIATITGELCSYKSSVQAKNEVAANKGKETKKRKYSYTVYPLENGEMIVMGTDEKTVTVMLDNSDYEDVILKGISFKEGDSEGGVSGTSDFEHEETED